MSFTFARAATAVVLLTSTVSAAFSKTAKNNVVVYWGQGDAQGPLADVCSNPSVDVVSIGFVNGFPKAVGEYPKTNHGNACWGNFPDPNDPTKESGLLQHCAGVEAAITACQNAGKKVLLSLGGGKPTDYYLPNRAVAEYFADFLIGAYGPVTSAWTDANKPRPFGNAVIDGFDLDLEADEANMPSGNKDLIFKNYNYFGQQVKAKSTMLLTGAPQCIVPDARLYDALKTVPFDMLFVQFYNTPECSARVGYTDVKKTTTKFTFDSWAQWLQTNAANKENIKLYIGLPAGEKGAGAAYKTHYLLPAEANELINKYKSRPMFGGVMLWENQVSRENIKYCKSYDYWIKSSLLGQFTTSFKESACASPSSSAILPSSTKVSSSRISSSTRVSSTLISSTRVSSSRISSSTRASSTLVSSTKVSSSQISSSRLVSSSKASSSAPASSTAKSSSIYSVSSKVSSSSIYVPSSTPASSIAKSSSVYSVSSKASSSSIYVPSSAVPSVSSKASVLSSAYVPSSAVPSSSAYDVSSVHSVEVSSSAYVPQPSESTYAYSASSSAVPVSKDGYPTGVASSSPYPEASGVSTYNPEISQSSPEAASSTPCTTSSQYYVIESSSAPAAESSAYSASQSDVFEIYPTPSAKYSDVAESSAYGSGFATSSKLPEVSSKYEEYPNHAVSSKAGGYASYPESSKVYDSVPSVTKGSEYPSKPSDATTTVVTTTYVDVCPTGLVTKTTTIVKTVCNSCATPTGYHEVPEGWTTSVYVSKTLTVTITKPAHPATDVPAYSSSVAYNAGYPSAPKPSSPSSSKPETPVYKEETPEKPAQPAHPTAAASSKAQEHPVHSAVPEYPKKPVEDATVTSTHVQHITLTKVPVPAYTPAPYPSAAPHVPVPAHNGTAAYVPLPTGTGKPSKPSAYSPSEFEGAAGRFSVGATAFVGVVAAAFLAL
ncbi:Chitinase 2 [Coniothyrium glycines]